MPQHTTRRPPGRPRRKIGSQPTRDQILETAAKLFARDGYTGVSIRNITSAVGIKESSLYNHFAGKEALLHAVFDQMEKEFAERAVSGEALERAIQDATPEEFMRASFQRFMEFWSDPARVRLWLVVAMEQFRNERAGRLVLDEMQRVRERTAFAFATMQRLKKIRPLNPAILAETFTGTLRGMQTEYAILMAAGKDTRGVTRRMHAFITFFATMITT